MLVFFIAEILCHSVLLVGLRREIYAEEQRHDTLRDIPQVGDPGLALIMPHEPKQDALTRAYHHTIKMNGGAPF